MVEPTAPAMSARAWPASSAAILVAAALLRLPGLTRGLDRYLMVTWGTCERRYLRWPAPPMVGLVRGGDRGL